MLLLCAAPEHTPKAIAHCRNQCKRQSLLPRLAQLQHYLVGAPAPALQVHAHRWCPGCRFLASSGQEEVILRSRKGLFKTSIETGAPVVPVYHLGNSAVLKFGPHWLLSLSRRLRTSLGFVYGKWGPIPTQHPIHMVSGDAIKPGALQSLFNVLRIDQEQSKQARTAPHTAIVQCA